jgi:hypothetical protein
MSVLIMRFFTSASNSSVHRKLQMDAEVYRARFCIADVPKRAGNDADALATLHHIQQECGRRGMHRLVRSITEKIEELEEPTK